MCFECHYFFSVESPIHLFPMLAKMVLDERVENATLLYKL